MISRNRYKLVVSDIDGTIMDRGGKISAEDMAAIAEARSHGVMVSLSSGRARGACLGIISQLSLDNYHIFFDGALVSSPDLKKEVYARPIDGAIVKNMIEMSHEMGMDLELYSAASYFVERETWSTQAHRDFFEIAPAMVDFSGIWERERVVKGLTAITNAEEAVKVKKFRQQFGEKLHFSEARTPAYPGVTFINILAAETSKGKAMEALAAHLGIPLAEVMAVGDGSNDVALLSSAGLAVAMGNALNEVKAVADYVTLDVDHSGLAAAIRKFVLPD
ncbi:MAG: Cof-type HAD-IIB family hydrolase [Dehalococcoidales bacterium]|nr:Cof-type HAD-IIB family hydrolase [Dehalococcoidales bacterium]